MKTARITQCTVEYDEKRIPLISGEFHYWRNFPDQWQPIMDAIKEMGLKVISTYIPWNFHELKPGEYDFEGRTNPRCNLTGFIEQVKENGFYLIVRPGPYIYSEWPNGGPPDYAVKYHRLDSQFIKYSKEYIKNVCSVLVPYQITRGGNIIMIQADNEPYPPVESFGDEIGCFRDKGIFKEWLRTKYNGDLDALNKNWKADYSSFDEACFYFHESYVDVALPMAERLLPHEKYYLRYADGHEFIGWYAAQIISCVASWLKESGIDIPIYANGWSPYYQNFRELSKVVDMVGQDLYPLQYMKGAGTTADEWLFHIDNVKLMKGELGYCWMAEFQSGNYPLRLAGYLVPDHFKYVAFSLMANGLCGWNWYMLVNRDNWCHCPINEWGRPNEYFPVYKEIVRIVNEVKPWQLDELTDISLLVWKPHKVISPGNWNVIFYALNEADVGFREYNPESGQLPQTRGLIYAGSDWLHRDVQELLLRYVSDGGTLILFNEFPQKDEFGDEVNILGLRSPDGARPVLLPVSVHLGEYSANIVNAGHLGNKVNFFYYHEVEAEPITVSLSQEAKEVLVDIGAVKGKSFIIGYRKTIGRGNIIHIGSNPSPLLILLALKAGALHHYVASSTPGVLTNIFRDREDDSLVLFVNNRDDAARGIEVVLEYDALPLAKRDEYRLQEITGSCRVEAKTGKSFQVFAEPNSVSIWRTATSGSHI